MSTTVQKWGNSLAVRLPRAFAGQLGITPGTTLNLAVENGRLVLTPVRPRRFTLTAMLKGVTRHNLHGEVESGAPAGREVW